MSDFKGFTTAGFRELLTKIGATFIKKTDVEQTTELSIDTTPTSGSNNLVTSDGVYNALSSKGTVTSVSVAMNGTTKGTVTTSGTIDLGTVITSHQDISGKQDKSTLETDVASKGFTKNEGTVTSVAVKMNGSTKGTITTSGTIDLGTVITSHQDISGKENTSNKVTTISSSSTDIQYPSAKCVYDYVQGSIADAIGGNY